MTIRGAAGGASTANLTLGLADSTTVSTVDSATLAKCETYKNLPQDILDFYDSEWLRLKN